MKYILDFSSTISWNINRQTGQSNVRCVGYRFLTGSVCVQSDETLPDFGEFGCYLVKIDVAYRSLMKTIEIIGLNSS